jgi:hypothetical protein
MLLSVVVTIVDAGPALRRCLEALVRQTGVPPLDIIVPFDDSLAGAALPRDLAGCRFLSLGTLPTAAPIGSHLGQHELFDQRRAAGLAAATGDLIAILEDRGVPAPDWAATFVRVHAARSEAAIGGAIVCGRSAALNQAVYWCDFGRYDTPFTAHESRFASDVNVCYKRDALFSVEPTWRERYHEPLVHAALIRSGYSIALSPGPVVSQIRDGLTLGSAVTERIAWGRLYGQLRNSRVTTATRVALIALAPLLPGLLLTRILRDRLRRSKDVVRALALSPLILMLVTAWSVGEALGSLASRADPATPGAGASHSTDLPPAPRKK